MPVMDDLLQVSEVNVMKLSALSIVIVLVGASGIAFAGNHGEVLPEVNVRAAEISGCTPPNDTTGHACDDYNRFLRANFTSREIGMLFGDSTSYPESMTGGIDRLQKRYDTLMRQYIAVHSAGEPGVGVAVK
jgi:hypothetical protein